MVQSIQGSFFPETYDVKQKFGNEKGYVYELRSKSESSICPNCGVKSTRNHDYQHRKIRDLPVLGKSLTLLVSNMKYYCDNADCEVGIFTEQTDLVGPYSQFTNRCREYMLKVASVVSCEAAVKILAYQGIRVCGDTLLSMIKLSGNKHETYVGKKIGVDDWAYRKGQKYGTLICDLDTHKIVDVLEGRDSETFETWLKGHPDIEIVSRDRASAYSSAVSKTLPNAIQIADRFHITKNLLEALEDTMKAFMPEVVILPTNETTSVDKSKIVPKKGLRN